jgi:hypothetical protein
MHIYYSLKQRGYRVGAFGYTIFFSRGRVCSIPCMKTLLPRGWNLRKLLPNKLTFMTLRFCPSLCPNLKKVRKSVNR